MDRPRYMRMCAHGACRVTPTAEIHPGVLWYKYNFRYFRFPRAHVPKRLPLNYASGENFEELIDVYLRNALLKGVPPLFTDIRSLYVDKTKIETIQRLMLGYLKNIHDTGYISQHGKIFD